MIKNASSVQKIPLQSILGPNVPSDAIALTTELLVFNPHKRLTAEEALEHEYISRFHDSDQEIAMQSNVVIPLNDDIRLSVDDYRNKLYELMATHHIRPPIKPVAIKQKFLTPEVYSRVTKNAEKYIKSHVHLKDKSYISQSEPKINNQKSSWLHTINIRSDSKVLNQQNLGRPRNRIDSVKGGGDGRVFMKSNSEVSKQRFPSNKNNLYTSFNSYNKNHGIISQSALMEFKAAGISMYFNIYFKYSITLSLFYCILAFYTYLHKV